MPMHLPEAPSGVSDKIKSKLHAFADGSHFSTKALRNARKDQLDLSTPHQIFTMGLDDVSSGGGLDRAQPTGWRYLIEDGGQLIASAETTLAPDGTQEVSQFTEGPFVAATDKAVKALRKLPELVGEGLRATHRGFFVDGENDAGVARPVGRSRIGLKRPKHRRARSLGVAGAAAMQSLAHGRHRERRHGHAVHAHRVEMTFKQQPLRVRRDFRRDEQVEQPVGNGTSPRL